MKPLPVLLISLAFVGSASAQNFQSTLALFVKKSIPYKAPSETYTDQYLEDGESTTIPYKPLSATQFAQISGMDECRCDAYAAEYFELKGGKKGLVVYQVNVVEVMPFEELSYDLYIVDGTGKPIDHIMLASDFFTSDMTGDISISEVKTSTINYGEYDELKERLFIEMIYESSEIMQADFGQIRTITSMVYMEIMPNGKMEDVTVYLEE